MKIGICGHFGFGKNFADGQTIKTRVLKDELIRILGESSVVCVDTCNWKANPFRLILHILYMSVKCDTILFMPDFNGLKVFGRMFFFIKRILRKKTRYVVIGGWLPEYLAKDHHLAGYCKELDGIYVETENMRKALQQIGFTNIYILQNFKRLPIVMEDEFKSIYEKPYKICTFSRVMKEKGIEEAIESVKKINEKNGQTVFTLDIYGQVDPTYKMRFEELLNEIPNYISYKGIIPYDKSVEVLKEYYLLLFPTYFESEGFAGTFIDAFAAGLPVLASDWRYNCEIIEDYVTGRIFPARDTNAMIDILYAFSNKPESIFKLKKNCLEKAKQCHPDKVIDSFICTL